jgi:hypothetical protein
MIGAEILSLRQSRRGNCARKGVMGFNNSKITRLVICRGKPGILDSQRNVHFESR